MTIRRPTVDGRLCPTWPRLDDGREKADLRDCARCSARRGAGPLPSCRRRPVPNPAEILTLDSALTLAIKANPKLDNAALDVQKSIEGVAAR